MPGLAAQIEWQIGNAYRNGHRDGLSCGVESAGLGFNECEHLTEDGYRPSSALPSAPDHRLREALERIVVLADGDVKHPLLQPYRIEILQVARAALEEKP